jgi:hypothetical protein
MSAIQTLDFSLAMAGSDTGLSCGSTLFYRESQVVRRKDSGCGLSFRIY